MVSVALILLAPLTIEMTFMFEYFELLINDSTYLSCVLPPSIRSRSGLLLLSE